jgi:hypothetical protein
MTGTPSAVSTSTSAAVRTCYTLYSCYTSSQSVALMFHVAATDSVMSAASREVASVEIRQRFSRRCTARCALLYKLAYFQGSCCCCGHFACVFTLSFKLQIIHYRQLFKYCYILFATTQDISIQPRQVMIITATELIIYRGVAKLNNGLELSSE